MSAQKPTHQNPFRDSEAPHTGRPVQIMCAVEGLMNFFIIIPMLLTPESTIFDQYLDTTGNDPLENPSLPHIASFLCQLLGLGMVPFTLSLLLAVPNKPSAPERRRFVYLELLVLEIAWLSICAWKLFCIGPDGTGLSKEKIVKFIMTPMVSFLVFRTYVFLVKPEWFGKRQHAKEE